MDRAAGDGNFSTSRSAMFVGSLERIEKLQLCGSQRALPFAWFRVISKHQKLHSLHLHALQLQSEGWQDLTSALCSRNHWRCLELSCCQTLLGGATFGTGLGQIVKAQRRLEELTLDNCNVRRSAVCTR